jgi:hypothetical protein
MAATKSFLFSAPATVPTNTSHDTRTVQNFCFAPPRTLIAPSAFGARNITSSPMAAAPLATLIAPSAFGARNITSSPMAAAPLATLIAPSAFAARNITSSPTVATKMFGVNTTGTQTVETTSPCTIKSLNMPKEKIMGLISMVCLDHAQSFEKVCYSIKNLVDVDHKFAGTNLWMCALVEYSECTVKQRKVGVELADFENLYSSLLQILMLETVHESDQLYDWLLCYSRNQKNKKLLWLFTILKYAKDNDISDVLEVDDPTQMLALAVQKFLSCDNNPTKAVELALGSTNSLFRTFLLALVGASYGVVDPNLTTKQLDDLRETVDKFNPLVGSVRDA